MTTNRRQFLGLIGGALALPTGVAAAARSGPPPIRLRRGMNMWPWFSLTREFPAPRTDYDWPPFQTDRPVPGRDDLLALGRAGIDFIRLPVDPGPLIAFAGERRAALFDSIAAAIEMAQSAGLSVVVNLHANSATHYFTPQALFGEPDAPLFARYGDLVGALAARLSAFDPARVALEPVNEPPAACTASAWTDIQAALVGKARAAAPSLPLVLTGACGSLIPGLTALDPAAIGDDNVIYTFHFYEPYVFTHQGAGWMTGEPMYPYLDRVPWPSQSGSKTATLTAIGARLAADAGLTADQRRALTATIGAVIDQYFAAPADRNLITRAFDQVTAWADRHGIGRDRVLLGEFGALRAEYGRPGAMPADRARYISDVRQAAEARGFPWAFWDFFSAMGLVIDDRSRRFDPAITSALGLSADGQ